MWESGPKCCASHAWIGLYQRTDTERGRILIGCRRRGATASIEVWDTGIGIPPDQFGEIFREFHRSHKKTHRAIEGFGIGLAVVDRLTTFLGHRIAVSSTPGKGTMFRIEGLSWREGPAR